MVNPLVEQTTPLPIIHPFFDRLQYSSFNPDEIMQMAIYFESFWLFAVITEIFSCWEKGSPTRIVEFLLKIAEFRKSDRKNKLFLWVFPLFSGYIDVGDRCWRPNVLVTRFGCCRQVTSPTSKVRHQHQISVINVTFWRIMMLVTDVSLSGSV